MVGELVAKDYQTASIFQIHGIDFCCNGNRSIKEVCTRAKVTTDELIQELDVVLNGKVIFNNEIQSLPIDELAEHIEKVHHSYVQKQIPVLNAFLEKLVKVHGERHPELLEIREAFKSSSEQLTMHMKKEELLLFPHVRKMVRAIKNNEKVGPAIFGTVLNPIEVMKAEHETEGDRFRRIAEWSNNYMPPEDACNTYRVAFNLLREFESDLHLHIHLENNILFPKAIELEELYSQG